MKLRLLALTFFLTLSITAQTQKELETGVAQMYNNTIKGNYEDLLKITYPKLFDIVPKNQMLEVLQNMINGDGYTMIIVDTPPNFVYGPIKKIGGGSYCMIKHDLKMKMIFKAKLTAEEGKQMIETFKAGMQPDEVSFDANENSITLKKRAEVIAVADTLTANNWTFLNRSGSPLMAKIFDAKVMKELGL
ncbi:MAG: hypothetical protein V4581_01650 [Bacteroidota bacterium]